MDDDLDCHRRPLQSHRPVAFAPSVPAVAEPCLRGPVFHLHTPVSFVTIRMIPTRNLRTAMVALVVRHVSGAEALRASLRTPRLRRNDGYRLLRLVRAYPPMLLQLGIQRSLEEISQDSWAARGRSWEVASSASRMRPAHSSPRRMQSGMPIPAKPFPASCRVGC